MKVSNIQTRKEKLTEHEKSYGDRQKSREKVRAVTESCEGRQAAQTPCGNRRVTLFEKKLHSLSLTLSGKNIIVKAK